MIVVDTNVIAYFVIPGAKTALAERVIERDPECAAPLLWRSEMRNVLSLNIRQNIFSLSVAKVFMTKAEILIGISEYNVDSEQVLDLANTSGCTAYDCEFAALAQQLRATLVTSDKQLLRAFPGLAVSMDDFAA